MISAHKVIYNIFGSGIYPKPHSMFKSKYQEFHKKNIGLFNINDTRMSGYFMRIIRDLRMWKFLQYIIFSVELNSITTKKNSPNKLGSFVIISRGKGAIHFSGLFFPVWELFSWKTVIMQEWPNLITIWSL